MECTKEKLKDGLRRVLSALTALTARARSGDAGDHGPPSRPAPVVELATWARRRYPRGRSHYERRVAANVIPMWRYTGRPRLEPRTELGRNGP